MSDVRFLLFVPETVEHMARATPNEVRRLLANAHITTGNPADSNPSGRGERRMGRATPNEVRQLLANAHVTTDNPASPNSARGERRLLIGRTDGGRFLTVVIEATLDPTTWLRRYREEEVRKGS